jgi:Mrp family chromosome partitioning ATPase
MFDNLRRAEQARRLKNGVREGRDDSRRPGGADVEVTAGQENAKTHPEAAPSRNGTGELTETFARELGILRNSLQAALKDKARRSILFTSATHQEGVTTLASSYARLSALGSDERVLLVEMNARRPSLFWRMGLGSENGVSHYLARELPLATIIQRDKRLGFDVIHVGEQDPTKVQLHLEKGFPQLLAEASAGYDTVLIDAPPVVLSPETPQIAGCVDGVVMVVHCGKTRREIVQRSIHMIEQFEGRVLGVVLNRKKYYIPDFLYQRV